MKNFNKFLSIALSVTMGLMGSNVIAADNDDVVINYQIVAIDELNFDGSLSLTIDSATAGSEPTDATDNSSVTYDVTTNGTNKKISCALDNNMPANTGLYVNLTAPSASGTSAGELALSTTSVDVVTGISSVAEAGIGSAWRFSATIAAGVISGSRTATFTLQDA